MQNELQPTRELFSDLTFVWETKLNLLQTVRSQSHHLSGGINISLIKSKTIDLGTRAVIEIDRLDDDSDSDAVSLQPGI